MEAIIATGPVSIEGLAVIMIALIPVALLLAFLLLLFISEVKYISRKTRFRKKQDSLCPRSFADGFTVKIEQNRVIDQNRGN